MVQTATRALKTAAACNDDIRIGTNTLSALLSRSTRLTIGSGEIPLTIWCMGGIRDHSGGYTASRVYKTARSRRAAMAISSPAILLTIPRTSQCQEAIADRADRHNEDVGSHQIETGSRIWLYLDRVKEGYARKLAHLWHGPFRVAEKINEFSVKLEIADTGYQIFPVDFPGQPRVELTVDEADRLDFDEFLLPEDSWVPDLGADEYEVERISDVRSGKKNRFGRIYREFLVHWARYDEPTWVDEADLNGGAI
ncbi:LOW QUALITY PROTEIN: hypothetical protein PHMEG_00018793 [Phytophthora megakarya]|uniref:Chromo domain-containing protein n=1 Tax=Phytophthora megakarya TaxID=4795 RepID=A0A225VU08_9STRA|nr:LOW QUALITY PROTEIN: hypothetical protein PHMEG_00018793 [Phytophthora megakarya]